jgi:inner membrane protein
MASAFSHAIAAVAIGSMFTSAPRPARFWVLGMTCAVLPDADVVGFAFGIPYEHMLGHRGLSHSLVFAVLLAAIIVAAAFSGETYAGQRTKLWWYLFAATASHGLLDAMTTGGLGVAFLAPFSDSRYFLPWRPILVSPISITRFFTERGLAVFRSEIVWIWLPSLILMGFGYIRPRHQRA